MRGGNHEILVTLKGKLLYVRLNGKTLFGGRVLLREKPRPGLLGMGVWDSVPGLAATHVLDARIMPRREAVVTWTPHTALDIGYLTEWLHMHSYRFSILSPPWIDIFESAPQKFPTWDQAALDLLARSVFVVAPDGTLAYSQLVGEVTHEPDYAAALEAVKKLA